MRSELKDMIEVLQEWADNCSQSEVNFLQLPYTIGKLQKALVSLEYIRSPIDE